MHKEDNTQKLTIGWILFAFVVWIYAFRGFLTSKLALTSDALSYYEHTKFFIENLAQGVYPLWDPYWFHGASNDFFLRRIGAFNPFYLVILLLKAIGIPYILSYLCFLALYYWGGMIAFYLLARRIYQDRFIAYAGYLILLFSALGTRLFDSYMMLVTVPLIWFFYFLVAFSQTPRKHFFLGMMLSMMILAGTYIPFYFLIILSLFLSIFILVYFKFLPGIFNRFRVFFKANKTLIISSLLILIFSFVPILIFFHDSNQGEVVLPYRHGNVLSGNVLTVSHHTLDWGAVEDLLFSAYFSNLRLYKFAVVYVPFFTVIILILGCIGRINRRAVFIFLLGIALFCCIVPHGLPFYDFFYKHLFFLKYFRNLHFFIWFFLIPLFVLLVLEHWKMFAEIKLPKPFYRWSMFLYIMAVHLIVLLFVWWRKDAILSTYIMLFMSFIFWSLMVLKFIKPNFFGYFLLTLTVLVQPLEVYYYLSLKADPNLNQYEYGFSFRKLELNNPGLAASKSNDNSKSVLYYSSSAYNFIYQNISNAALDEYLQNKFILVDHVMIADHDSIVPLLEQNFSTDANVAFIDKNKIGGVKLEGDDPQPPIKAQAINSSFKGFELLSFNANHARLSLDLPYDKFLVYNDNDSPYWRISINGREGHLNQVNGTFKGAWIPAGKSIVEFRYGSWWQYAINYLLSFFAFIFLLGIIWYARIPDQAA